MKKSKFIVEVKNLPNHSQEFDSERKAIKYHTELESVCNAGRLIEIKPDGTQVEYYSQNPV